MTVYNIVILLDIEVSFLADMTYFYTEIEDVWPL